MGIEGGEGKPIRFAGVHWCENLTAAHGVCRACYGRHRAAPRDEADWLMGRDPEARRIVGMNLDVGRLRRQLARNCRLGGAGLRVPAGDAGAAGEQTGGYVSSGLSGAGCGTSDAARSDAWRRPPSR